MGLQCPDLIIYLVSLPLFHLIADQPPTINLNGSRIIGTTFRLSKEEKAYKFLGIPYAEPPVGKNRFQAPRPFKIKEDLEAIKYKKDCPQKPEFFPMEYSKSNWDEDCLYLNLFLPKMPNENSTDLLPVMVYIHEGGFLEGSGRIPNPFKLMEKNVILMTFNYRLGALGFLSTGKQDRTIAGNFGLMDQREVLRWVKKNIFYFGGNVDKITLFGVGVGGASAALLMLYTQSEDLFSAATLQSGTALNWWTIRSKPEEVTKRFATRLNCTLEPISAMLQCLWNKPADDIVSSDYAVNLLELNEQLPNLPFAPVIDGYFIDEDPEIVLKNLKSNNISLIVGVVKDDASIYLLTYPELEKNNYTVTEEFILNNLKAFDRGGILGEAVTTAIKFEYVDMKPETDPEKWRKTVIEMASDAVFTSPAVKTVQLLMKKGAPVYMYTFEYESIDNPFHLDWLGAYQSSEKYYITGLPQVPTSQDLDISEMMATYWANFAKYRNPSPEDSNVVKWSSSHSEENIEYLQITETPKMNSNYRKRQVTFWNEYIFKLYSITDTPKPSIQPTIIMEYKQFQVYQGVMILMTILTVLLMILLAGVLFHKYKGPPNRKISRVGYRVRSSIQMETARRISTTNPENP